LLNTMTTAPTTTTGHATAPPATDAPPGLANHGGRSLLVMLVAGHRATGARTGAGVPSTQPARGVTLQDLLRRRAELPAGHPDRAVLRARSIEAGLPLARRLAARFRGRGEPFDDLYQVAALALIKAVDCYDPCRQAAFSTYAIPTILGALKRHFRDSTWRVRVPRPIQDLALALTPTTAGLAQQLGRWPTLQELAKRLDTTDEDVARAANAWRARYPDSLDAPSPAGGEPQLLIDTIGAVDERLDGATNRHSLRPLLAALPAQQRRILAMRYYADMTQAQIAAQIGVSQMHISRVLARTLTQLRARMLTEQPTG
jgi:RNA polymerase sigma-B factor